MTETNIQIFERLSRRFSSPHHEWMGFTLKAVEDEWVEVAVPWRDEFVGAPGMAQGAIIAAMVDVAAEYAIAARFGNPVPTINLHIDYHRPARPGTLTARGRVIRLGATVTTAEARVFDFEGELVASGRGSFFTARPSTKRG